jgi:hypothetical protein
MSMIGSPVTVSVTVAADLLHLALQGPTVIGWCKLLNCLGLVVPRAVSSAVEHYFDIVAVIQRLNHRFPHWVRFRLIRAAIACEASNPLAEIVMHLHDLLGPVPE